MCIPKKSGGLGIRNLEVWNVAAIGNIAWHISTMHESLWLKWVHEMYMKGGKWEVFNPPTTSSWAFKKICSVKEKLWEWMGNRRYYISDIYLKLLNPPGKVNWASWAWSRYALPKQDSFLGLLSSTNLKSKTVYTNWVLPQMFLALYVIPIANLPSIYSSHAGLARDAKTWS